MKKGVKSSVERWKVNLSNVLEFLILLSGFYQLFFGETAIGVLILVTLAIILFPKVMTRGLIPKIPLEVEIILFIMVFLQLVLGEARDFYTTVPYYDKIVHFVLPMFLGLITFLIFYTMQSTGNLKASKWVTIILVVLLALGIGAFWEILEYSSDRWLYPNFEDWHHFQGNAQQSANDDTMTDLITDTLGGIFGAVLALWFTTKTKASNRARLDEITSDLSLIYVKPKTAKTKKGK